jgi:hypothetical protein
MVNVWEICSFSGRKMAIVLDFGAARHGFPADNTPEG